MAYKEIFDEAVRLRKSGAGRRPGRELTLEDKARLYPVRDSKSGKRDLYYWHPGRNEFRHHVAICTALERSVISNVAGIKPSAEALAAIGSPQSLADLEVGPSPETPEPAPKRAAAPSSSAAGAATAQQQDKRPRTQDAGGPSSSNPQVLQAQGVGPPSREKERSVAEELHAAKLKEKQLQRELDAEKRAHAATALDVWRPPTAPIAPTAAAPVASDGIADAEQDAAEPHQGSTQPDAVQAELLKPTRFAIICIEAPGQRDTKVYVPLSSAHTFGRLDKAVGGAACIGRLRKWQPIKIVGLDGRCWRLFGDPCWTVGLRRRPHQHLELVGLVRNAPHLRARRAERQLPRAGAGANREAEAARWREVLRLLQARVPGADRAQQGAGRRDQGRRHHHGAALLRRAILVQADHRGYGLAGHSLAPAGVRR